MTGRKNMRTSRNTRTLHAGLTLLALLACGAASAASIGPDAFGYVADDAISYSFVDISSTGVAVLGGADDETALLNIGFPFRFYGLEHTAVCVSSNGLLSLGGCNAGFANQDLSATKPAGDLPTIAALWTDLTFAARGAGAVYYQTLGEPGNRRFIVQWTNAFALNGARGVTFQALLHESGGKIVFQYLDLNAGAGSPVSFGGAATVGIRDAAGESNGRRLQWSYKVPVLRNGQAIAFVTDTTAPVITPTVAGTQGAPGWYLSDVTVSWDVADPESGVTSTSGCDAVQLGTETTGTTLTCSATNSAGLSSSASVTIAIDKTAPAISGLPAPGCQLWPPNHKLVQVGTVAAADTLSGLATLTVTATSNQPQGDAPDIEIRPSGEHRYLVLLRAEREGAGERVYTVTAQARDLAGNGATAQATCTVPHDRGR
jgi:hypothetical protein